LNTTFVVLDKFFYLFIMYQYFKTFLTFDSR